MAIGEDCSTPVPAPSEHPAAPVAPGADGPANPTALTVDQLAKLLGIRPGKVEEHIAAGAPTGPGRTINLVHYTAWLNKETAGTKGGEGGGI